MLIKASFATCVACVVIALYVQKFHPTVLIEIIAKVPMLKDITNDIHSWFLQTFYIASKDDSVHSGQKSGKDEPAKHKGNKLFTEEELRSYNGKDGSRGLYLAILGKVYDVKKGEKHYGPGGSYHFFTGRDASRAFVTGDFTEKGLVDDLTGLSAQELQGIRQWSDLYEKDYKYVGNLIGRYYDSDGNPTKYLFQVQSGMEAAEKDKQEEEGEKRQFPPCNVEWSRETGTRVWCSERSGGIHRDWIGVPRKFYKAGSTTPRCACIKTSGESIGQKEHQSAKSDLNDPRLKEYEGCDPTSHSCFTKT